MMALSVPVTTISTECWLCFLQAHLHARRGEKEQAAHYFKLNLEAIDTMNLSGSDAVAALDFLAEHSMVRRSVHAAAFEL